MIRSWSGPLQEELRFPSWINLTRRSFVIILAKRWWQNRICWRSRGPQHRATTKDMVTSNLLQLNRFVKGSTLKTIPCSFAFRFFINFDNTKSYTFKFETKCDSDQSQSIVCCKCCQATGQYPNISNYDKLPNIDYYDRLANIGNYDKSPNIVNYDKFGNIYNYGKLPNIYNLDKLQWCRLRNA